MRIIALAAAALLSSASIALAAPASVSVSIGPELQEKAEKTYGVVEVNRLAEDLRQEVERALARSGRHQDARIELVLTDAKPNRPTFKQLSDTPGLSFQSFGVGGAAVEGRIVTADGAEIPVDYDWYESDITQAFGHWTWWDAERTFDRLANRIARGEQLARR